MRLLKKLKTNEKVIAKKELQQKKEKLNENMVKS